jgi:hypothetical protein
MAEDTKMKGENPKTEEAKKEEKVETPPMPALEAAARRLERLLGGGLSEKDRHLHTYANPAKVVRRWLGTASGASGNATFADIASAATTLLDPAGPCSKGLQILIADNDGAMDVDSSESKKLGFLTIASSREVESWLISLSVRLLWKEKKLTEAFDLVQKGIAILLEHLNVASTNLTSLSGVSTSSVFPTLARMYRYRALVAEAMKNDGTTASLRQDMVKAHNLACLRRDVDSQATLLNLMLRDLLLHSQSKLCFIHSYPPALGFTHSHFPVASRFQSSKHTSCSPTRHSQSLLQTISFVVTCTTAAGFSHCVWNTLRPFRTSVNVCVSPLPTLALASVLPHSVCWWWYNC